MSSGPNPNLSPFVRGTTDATHSYYLESGARRLIPDQATLNFMLAGQTVRVLSDAALAAIPPGAPLPSRADGALLTQKFAVPPPGAPYYLMTAGLRRRVPDIATTLILTHSVPAVSVELADLTAIPEGPMLPTRADQTLYRGTAGAFAYLLASGAKRAFPDATTLRDAGHDLSALIPISDADAALIPNGPPFQSTSRFLNPPSAEIPLVLLPAHLETRFQGNELWLRVYPDTVHINSFEPLLTSDEQSARAAYLAQAQAGSDTAKAAFGSLARRFGARRAAWIASSNVPAGSKDAQWSQAPFTNVLPERWIVIGYLGNAAGQVLAVGPPILDNLHVGPAPTGSGLLAGPEMKWVTDFDAAIQIGMAFRISLAPDQQRGFDRIVVLGLKTSLSAKDSASRLGDLLQAHHYTDGLEFLPLNAPTNNTENVNAGFSSKTDYDATFAIEQGAPLCPSRPTGDGDRLAAALSITPALLAHVTGANGAQDEMARAMNTVMWPATWGYYLTQLVNGSVPNPDVMVPAVRSHFASAVRARGHFPVVRIGRQPYGVLPVCWSARWKSLEGHPLDGPLARLLSTMRTTWESSLPNVPRIPGSSDPEASLTGMLGMTATSNSFSARNVLGPEYNFGQWDFVQNDLPKTWWAKLNQMALAGTSDFSTILANTRLANSAYVREPRLLTNVLVAPDPLDGMAAPSYITQIGGLGWQALRDMALPAAPLPLFFLLLRHAALRQYMDSALDLLVAAGTAQPPERLEAELLGFSTAIRPTAWDLLSRTLPGKGPVGTFLDGAKKDPTVPEFAEFWSAFAQLSGFSAADLDAAAREVFDLASYRLDAWVTSLAYFRLENLRTANPDGGIVLGGFGWLENVRPQSQPPSAGFIHAPSLNQSTTAAVLRAGYLAHNDASSRPFELDLSSAKVRLGMHLLDGIREGQTLGALLGYRLERTMHDLGLDEFIDDVRVIAPVQGPSNDLDVVDGRLLLQEFGEPDFWNHPGLPAAGTAQRDSLTSAITRLNEAVDAVADLTLTESVHQLIRGNLLRAGATLDSIARGDTPPAEIEVVSTPRSGTALTYRLATIAPEGSAAGWGSTPRALAEPRLNAWAAAVLGDPKSVRIQVRFLDAQGTALNTVEIAVHALGLAPLDLLSLPEAQGVPQELSDRVRRLLWPAHPAAATDIQVLTDRDPNWKPEVVAITECLTLVQAVSRLVNSSRPLLPQDLVLQDGAPGAMDTAELTFRADAAEAAIRAALLSLTDPSANDSALLAAASFGVTGAVPNTDPARWPAQIAFATVELNKRASQLDQLASGFARAPATPEQSYEFDAGRLKAIFGASFQVLPLLAQGAGDLWANSTSLQGNDPLESVRWFQRAARVRPGAGRLDTAVLLAEALSGQLLLLQFKVAQLPASPSDKWMALKDSSSLSRLSIVAFLPGVVTPGGPIAGLMVDQWTEVLPSPQQITGVAFQYADPIARPPQSILLAVKADDFPEWTMEAVEGSVLEALDLARIRAVDPDSLGALGHYLPALYFAFNTGAPRIETVAVDLNAALKSSLGSNA